MNQIETIDDVSAQHELDRRRRRLVIIAPCGAIACLALSLAAAIVLRGGPTDLWVASLLAVPVGAILGLAHAPVLCMTIARKKQVLALPIIYVAALAAAAAVASSGALIWSVVTLGLLVPILALLLTALLPSDLLMRPDVCSHCGYTLSGHSPDVCPECGAPTLLHFPRPRFESPGGP